MLKEYLYWIVYRLSDIHNWILQINNGYEYNLSDKMLHFLVVGVVGMVLFWIVHPVVHFLARRGLQVVISWFYALTLVVVLTFGIEIGQKITGTGHMEFADIVFGVGGYLAMFAVYMLFCLLILGIRKLFRHWRKKK